MAATAAEPPAMLRFVASMIEPVGDDVSGDPQAKLARKTTGGAKRPRLSLRTAAIITVAVLALVVPLGLLTYHALAIGDLVTIEAHPGNPTPGVMPGAVTGDNVVVTAGPAAPANLSDKTRATVQIRLSSEERSRILVVRRLQPPGPARLVWPQDGEYFDLGGLPEPGKSLTYRVRSLLANSQWGLVPAPPNGTHAVEVTAGTQRTLLAFRVVERHPVTLRECLARTTFFLRLSKIAALTFLVSLAAFVGAVAATIRRRPALAAAGFASALVLSYSALTPMFQAADETSHLATLEWELAGGTRGKPPYWPASLTAATRALDQDRVQYHPEESMPLGGPVARTRAADLLRQPLTDQASVAGNLATEAGLQDVGTRSPLFYPLARLVPGAVLRWPVIERLMLYRLLAAGLGLAGVLCGIAALAVAKQPLEMFIGIVLIVAVPEWAGIMGSTTNYAPGMGLALLATCLALNALTSRPATALAWLCGSVAVALLGGFFLPDNLLLAAIFLGFLCLAAGKWLVDHFLPTSPTDRRWVTAAIVSGVVLLAVATATLGVTLLPFTGAGDQPANLVRNGDAETGTLDNWTGFTKVVSDMPHAGKFCFLKQGPTLVKSNEFLPIDPATTYTLSGWFRATSNNPSTVFLGYVPYDADKNPIQPANVLVVPGSETSLVDACKADDTILEIADGAMWTTGEPTCIAFEVDDTGRYSDLPNRKLTSYSILRVENRGDHWVVQLKNPCGQTYPAGTKVREHSAGGTYIYNAAGGRSTPAQWTQFSATIRGVAKSGAPADQWWHGTKYAQILMLLNYGQSEDVGALADDITMRRMTFLSSPTGWLGTRRLLFVTEVASRVGADRGEVNLTRWLPIMLLPLLGSAVYLALTAFAARLRPKDGQVLLAVVVSGLVVLGALIATLVAGTTGTPTSAVVIGLNHWLFRRIIINAAAGTSLAWDQDFFVWKTFLGALGWHDLLLPEWAYAVSRWISTLALASVPLLFATFDRKNNRGRRLALLFFGAGLTVLTAAFYLRTTLSVFLHGRYLLFALPLVVLPICYLASARAARWSLLAIAAGAVALSLFTILHVTPTRYLFTGGGLVSALLP